MLQLYKGQPAVRRGRLTIRVTNCSLTVTYGLLLARLAILPRWSTLAVS